MQRYLIANSKNEVLTLGHRKLKNAIVTGKKLTLKHGLIGIWDTQLEKYIKKLHPNNIKSQ